MRHAKLITLLVILAVVGFFSAKQLFSSDATLKANAAVSFAAPSHFMATNGSDSNPCTQAAPCKTFARAYQASSGGDTVQVEAGTYPQELVKGPSKTSLVTFIPHGTVTWNCDTLSTVGGGTIGGQSCIDIAVSNIAFQGGIGGTFRSQTYVVHGFTYQGRIDTERNISNVIFNDVDVGAVAVGSSLTQVTNSDLGPSVDPLNNRQADGDGNIWTGNNIHDYIITNGGHMECLTWDAGTNVTMSNNHWSNCAVFAIFAKPTDNISGKVENNTFAPSSNTNNDLKISLGSGADHCYVNVFGNSFTNGEYYDCPGVTFNNPGSGTTTSPTTTAGTTTTPTTTTIPPSVKTLLEQAKVNLLASNGYKSWAKANPGELSAINNYNANGGTLPNPKTQFGQFYLKFSRALSAS